MFVRAARTALARLRLAALSPGMKAAPVELLGGAHLVRESEIIGPPFLLRAPATAPAEVEDVRRAARARLERSVEVRASRRSRDRHAINGQIGLVGEHLLEQALHLHPRDVRVDPDARRLATREQQANVRLEVLIRARTREQCLQLFQLTTSGCRTRLYQIGAIVTKYRT